LQYSGEGSASSRWFDKSNDQVQRAVSSAVWSQTGYSSDPVLGSQKQDTGRRHGYGG